MKKTILFCTVVLLLLTSSFYTAHAHTAKMINQPPHLSFADESKGARRALSADEAAALRELCLTIWQPHVVANWEMNEELADVVIQAIQALGQCDRSIDLILQGLGQITLRRLPVIVRTVVNAVIKMLEVRPGLACKNGVALSFRTRAELAGLGI